MGAQPALALCVRTKPVLAVLGGAVNPSALPARLKAELKLTDQLLRFACGITGDKNTSAQAPATSIHPQK